MNEKKYRIGVIADLFRQPLEQALATSAATGAEGVQLFARGGELTPAASTERRAQIRRALAENGLVLTALCSDTGSLGDPERNPELIAYTKAALDLALDLGSNIVTCHIGVLPEDPEDAVYKNTLAACTELAAYAAARNAWFAVETGPEFAVVLKGFLDRIPGKGFGVNLDPANLHMVAGDDPVKAVYTLKDYIVHTHAKDGIMLKNVGAQKIYAPTAEDIAAGIRPQDCYKEVPLGTGGVDFNAYFKALEDIGYRGWLTIESSEDGGDAAAAVTDAVSFLKKYC